MNYQSIFMQDLLRSSSILLPSEITQRIQNMIDNLFSGSFKSKDLVQKSSLNLAILGMALAALGKMGILEKNGPYQYNATATTLDGIKNLLIALPRTPISASGYLSQVFKGNPIKDDFSDNYAASILKLFAENGLVTIDHHPKFPNFKRYHRDYGTQIEKKEIPPQEQILIQTKEKRDLNELLARIKLFELRMAEIITQIEYKDRRIREYKDKVDARERRIKELLTKVEELNVELGHNKLDTLEKQLNRYAVEDHIITKGVL